MATPIVTMPALPRTTDACFVCRDALGEGQTLVAMGKKFHPDCFLCHQCLEPFPGGRLVETVGGSLLCEDDYRTLFGDRCARCGERIMGKCVTALDLKWHPEHFTCEDCGVKLAGTSFVKRRGAALCKLCNAERKRLEEEAMRNLCARCKKPMLEGERLSLRGETFHARHFSCSICKQELTSDAKEHDGKLFCRADYEKVTAASCYVCRAPILGRSINAMGRNFHPEHFICFKCEKSFTNSMFYEFEGKCYCDIHYNEIVGASCGRCGGVAQGRVVSALNKKWCEWHFMCIGCDKNMNPGKVGASIFVEWDLKPMCRGCYENLPNDVRRKVAKFVDVDRKVKEQQAAMLEKKKG